jgi:type I restriction enzyme S subunit
MTGNNNLPKHWQFKKLGEVCRIIYGKGLPVKELKSSGFPVFGANGIIGFYDKYLFEEPQVLISCRGAASGKINLSPPKCFVTNNSLVLDINEKNELDNTYLFYALNIAKKTKLVTGTAQPQVTINNAADLDICYPSLPEQHAIIAKIEELISELENGKEQLKTAQQQLKVYRQSLLKWAFEGKLTNKKVKEGELPNGWKIDELKNVCVIKRGKSKHRPRNEPALYGGKYPFIQTGDIREVNGGYIKKYSQTYSELGLQQSKLWPKGTLCITIAANIGETAILDFDACFPDSVVGLLSNEKLLLNKYTNYFFISHKSKLEKLAPATAQKNINVDILEKVKIPVPLIDEQQLIVSELESKLTVCDKIEETISQSLQQAETLRQSILKKAFEGKLIVNK